MSETEIYERLINAAVKGSLKECKTIYTEVSTWKDVSNWEEWGKLLTTKVIPNNCTPSEYAFNKSRSREVIEFLTYHVSFAHGGGETVFFKRGSQDRKDFNDMSGVPGMNTKSTTNGEWFGYGGNATGTLIGTAGRGGGYCNGY